MMRNNILIAITGGIGSGKSTVCKFIADCGYTVLSCDKIYADLLNSGTFNVDFKHAFGEVFNIDGSVNKKKLADLVFANLNMLKKLNAITHPKIIEEVNRRASEVKGICFVEVPLLFERNLQDNFDKVIVIIRKLEDRINSIICRDNLHNEDVIKRINNQFDYYSADLSPYFVIDNDGDLQQLKNNILILLKNISIY